jgi:hypothetical protein
VAPDESLIFRRHPQLDQANRPLRTFTLVTLICEWRPETGSSSGVTCIVTVTPSDVVVWWASAAAAGAASARTTASAQGVVLRDTWTSYLRMKGE